MSRYHEMSMEVFQAVFEGNLQKARETLDLMVNVEADQSGALLAMRTKVKPLPPVEGVAETFPYPGHLPGSTEAYPRFEKADAA